jgi:NAD(P)H dehydrogenase (quinone)
MVDLLNSIAPVVPGLVVAAFIAANIPYTILRNGWYTENYTDSIGGALAGDEAWTLADLAAEISRRSGKEIPYRNLPEAEYAAALEGFGMPAPVVRMIAGWDTGASQGALFDDSHQLSRLIDRPTTPLSETVREALRQGG